MRILLVATLLLLAAPPLAAASAAEASDAALDAPLCQGFVGVRCASGNTFCWVYVNLVVRECVEV